MLPLASSQYFSTASSARDCLAKKSVALAARFKRKEESRRAFLFLCHPAPGFIQNEHHDAREACDDTKLAVASRRIFPGPKKRILYSSPRAGLRPVTRLHGVCAHFTHCAQNDRRRRQGSGFEGGRSPQNENGFQTRKKEPPFRRNLYKITRFFRQKKRKKACKTLIVLIYY